jgi:hypothetical protein
MAGKRRALREPPEGQVRVPPLLRFIRALNEAERETETEFLDQFVAALEPTNGKKTTKGYLYQLAGNERPNPTLRLAKAIVEQSRVFAPRVNTRPLAYEDLLVGCVPTNRLRECNQ